MHREVLQVGAVVGELAGHVQHQVDDHLVDGVGLWGSGLWGYFGVWCVLGCWGVFVLGGCLAIKQCNV